MINENIVRQQFLSSSNLLMLLTMRQYSIDFLREIVQSRSEQQKKQLEEYLQRRLYILKQNTVPNFIFGFDTDQFNKNLINYLSNCNVINRDLKDNIQLFKEWDEHSKIIQSSWTMKTKFKIC